MATLKELLGWDSLLVEAVKRRAKRNLRQPRMEIVAILREVLADELAALQSERLSELPDSEPTPKGVKAE